MILFVINFDKISMEN